MRERATKDVAHFASSRRLYIPRLVCSWVAWTKQEPVKTTVLLAWTDLELGLAPQTSEQEVSRTFKAQQDANPEVMAAAASARQKSGSSGSLCSCHFVWIPKSSRKRYLQPATTSKTPAAKFGSKSSMLSRKRMAHCRCAHSLKLTPAMSGTHGRADERDDKEDWSEHYIGHKYQCKSRLWQSLVPSECGIDRRKTNKKHQSQDG